MAKILIIDDEDLFRQLIVDLLASQDHETWEAKDGETGFEKFKEIQPDLVITDILMPEKEGMQTIRELRRESSDVKIIAMTGGGTHPSGLSYLQMAQEFGANHTFAKPFKTSEFLQVVKDLTQP